MKKYYCDQCDRELFSRKLTITTNNDFCSVGFNIVSNVKGEESYLKNRQRLDFCNRDCMCRTLFGVPIKENNNEQN